MATRQRIDITGLKDYVQDPKIVIGKLLNRQTALSLFTPHTGIHPGKTVMKFYSGGGQLGQCCGDRPGGGKFTQKEVEAVCRTFGDEFCPDELNAIIKDANARYTAGNKSLGSVEAIIMDQELAAAQITIDKLIFQGDKSLADTNLNAIDGLIKQALAIEAATEYDEGTALQAARKFLRSLNLEAWDGGVIAVLADPNIVTGLSASIWNANNFHFAPNTMTDPYTPVTIPGYAGVVFYPMRGMLGTGYMIATPLANVHWYTNLTADHMTALWDYNSYHNKYFWDIAFILGLTFGIDEWVKIAKVDQDVIDEDAETINVNIKSPLNADGDAIQTEEKA